jgi:hypothetical protein
MFARFVNALPLSVTVLLCSLPALVLSGIMAWSRIDDIRQDSEDELAHTTAAYADRMEHEVGYIKLLAQQLADHLTSKQDWTFITEAAKLMALPQGYNIVVHRADGTQIYNAQYPILHNGSQLRDSGTVDRTMVAGSTVVSDMLVSPYTKDFRTAVTAPIWRNGVIFGAVSITFDSAYLATVVGQRGMRERRRWAAIDGQGNVLARSARIHQKVGERISDNLLDLVRSTDVGLAWITPTSSRVPAIAAWQQIGGTNWRVGVLMDQAEVMTKIYIMLMWYAAALAATIGVIAYAAIELTSAGRVAPAH